MEGLDTSHRIIPETHDLHKLDEYLHLPKGTAYKAFVLQGDPTLINEKLIHENIMMEEFEWK